MQSLSIFSSLSVCTAEVTPLRSKQVLKHKGCTSYGSHHMDVQPWGLLPDCVKRGIKYVSHYSAKWTTWPSVLTHTYMHTQLVDICVQTHLDVALLSCWVVVISNSSSTSAPPLGDEHRWKAKISRITITMDLLESPCVKQPSSRLVDELETITHNSFNQQSH